MSTPPVWPLELQRRYGRKQGLLRHAAARLAGALGAWRPYAEPELARVRRMVFVCQGNVCRSAYAQARAEALGLPAASFGLGARPGDPAAAAAVATARRRGVELGRHRARDRAHLELTPSDLLCAMEPRQAQAVRAAMPAGAQVTLLGLWATEPRPHLEDPYGLSDAYFDTCFAIIDAALDQLALAWRSP